MPSRRIAAVPVERQHQQRRWPHKQLALVRCPLLLGEWRHRERPGFAKPLATARNLHKNIVNAIGEEYHAEKERRQSVRLSLRSSVSSSAPTSPARESPASSPAKVGAGAKSAAEPAPLAEVSDSASESDDDDDADSAAAEAPKPLQLGISGRDLVTHAKPVLPLAEAGGVLLFFDACFLVSIGAAARQAHRDRDGRTADQVLP